MQAVLGPLIAASGPVLTALAIEGKRQWWLWRWRRDNLPITYVLLPKAGVLSTQPPAGSGHSMARVS